MGSLFNYFNIWVVCACSGPLPFDSWMIKSLWAPESAQLGYLRSDGATSLPWRGQSKWRAAATSFGFYLMCACACARAVVCLLNVIVFRVYNCSSSSRVCLPSPRSLNLFRVFTKCFSELRQNSEVLFRKISLKTPR